MAARRKLDRRRVDTRFSLLKYCSRAGPSVENCDSPILSVARPLPRAELRERNAGFRNAEWSEWDDLILCIPILGQILKSY
jgi:hypothetical protein